MNINNYTLAKEHILAVVQLAAEDKLSAFKFDWGQAEQAWADRSQPEARQHVLTHMVGRLLDGLSYGNWPVVR